CRHRSAAAAADARGLVEARRMAGVRSPTGLPRLNCSGYRVAIPARGGGSSMSMPGWLGRIAAGAIGGLVGGVVFGAVMQLTDTLELVASLVDQESIPVGWAVHLSIAVSVGMVYTFVFGLF